MGKYCSNCGKELNEIQDVCLNCGVIVKKLNQNDEKIDKRAVVGFILSLISIIAWLIPLFGYPVSICGIIFSAKGLSSKANKGKAIAGLILSIIFLFLTLCNSLAGIYMWLDSYYY